MLAVFIVPSAVWMVLCQFGPDKSMTNAVVEQFILGSISPSWVVMQALVGRRLPVRMAATVGISVVCLFAVLLWWFVPQFRD